MRVMAVGAHPDDIELQCAGTLARCIQRGDAVAMVYMTNGNMGHTVIMPEELAEIRHEEAKKSADVIGASFYWLDHSDFTVEVDPVTTMQLVEVIRDFRPDLLITHSDRDYIRDHNNTGHVVFKASFDASVPHVEGKNPFHNKIVPIFEMDTLFGLRFEPTEYVDITAVIETKKRALGCHESQVKWLKEHDGIDVVQDMLVSAQYRGLQCGVKYAEGFKRVNVWGRLGTERLLP